jgi:hypothetical protein
MTLRAAKALAEMKSPFIPLFQRGKKLNAFLDSPRHDRFPSLKKHALSAVEGRG